MLWAAAFALLTKCCIHTSVRTPLYLTEAQNSSCSLLTVWVMSDGQNEGCFLKFLASFRKHIDLLGWFVVKVYFVGRVFYVVLT